MSCGLIRSGMINSSFHQSLRWKSSHSNGKSAHSDGKPATTPMEKQNHSDGKLHLTPMGNYTSQQLQTFANTKIISLKWCLVGRCIVEVNGNTILTRDASIRSV